METSPSISEPPTEECAGGIERRRSRRYDCAGYVKAWVSDHKSPIHGEILNISLTGCFISTKARLHVEHLATVDLHFTILDGHYRTTARVIDVRQGKGAGLEFIFPDSHPAEWLKDLLEMLSAAAEAPPERA
jgi:hypothetical protein